VLHRWVEQKIFIDKKRISGQHKRVSKSKNKTCNLEHSRHH
jgi:hypothetical protein